MTAARIDGCTFAVIDLETTGIDAASNRIVEVAVLACDWTGRELDRFETLVRPGDLELAGARAEMLAEAPTFAEVAGEVIGRLVGRVVAGHNVSFDLRFLDAELSRFGHCQPGHAYVCTHELATVLGCDVANRTLAALCEYFGVTFPRWHTAAGDAAATAAVLAALLARAARFGRVGLASVQSWWPGLGTEWPALPPGGRVLVRDRKRWPPTGDQPGSRRAREASFRRLGEGPASPSGVVVVSQPGTGDGEGEPPAASANERWWLGDLRGMDGIRQLEAVIVPAFRTDDDPELARALVALADLLRRHGGRDAEVRAAFAEACDVAGRRGDDPAAIVEQWWSYLAGLRDVEGLVELLPRCPDPIRQLRAQVVSSRRLEPLVAEELARRARAALASAGDREAAWEAAALLAQTLEVAGRDDESGQVLEEAWAAGCTSAAVLDQFSSRLERDGQYERAVEVCARGIAGAAADPAGVPASIRQRHRRCQQQLGEAARLFG